MKRIPFLALLLVLLIPSVCHAQGTASRGSADLSANNVWKLEKWELWRNIHEKCGTGGGFGAWRSSAAKIGIRERRAKAAFTNCVAARMQRVGASPQAVAFAKQMGGEFYMGSFREMGKVDLATTVAPLWNDPNVEDFILVNGTPRIVYLWEKVENIDITRDRLYPLLSRKFPEITMWPMHNFVSMRKLSKGGQRFVFSFILLNGCHACDIAGFANIAFDFDQEGNFQRTELLRLTEYAERIDPQYAPPSKEVTVSNFEEFLSAVAPNTTIKLKPGEYIINEALLRNANNPYVSWAENQFESDSITIRFGLTIKNVSNLKIVGMKNGGKPHFIQPNESATVIIFNNTFNVALDNVLIGHSPTTRECFAGVVAFYDSDKIKISNSDLYGSGTTGIELFNVHELDFFDSVIRECTALIVQVGYDSDGVVFRNSKFINNEAQEIRVFENSSNVSFTDLEIVNNGHTEYDSALFDIWNDCKNVTLTKSRVTNNKIGWFESIEGNLIYDGSNEIDFSQFRKGRSFSLASQIRNEAVQPPSDNPSNNWTEFNRGQTKGAFQFSQRRTLFYNGRPILGFRFRPSVQKIAISPSAVGGRYAICVTFDDIESAAFLLRLDNHSGKQLALQGPPSVWAAWSPAGTHGVIGSYYEADEALYSINLSSGIARRLSFKVAKQTEEESSDLDNLTWVDDRVFRVRVTVNCNPYTDDNCSDQDRKKVLREYEVRANVVSLAVSSERVR